MDEKLLAALTRNKLKQKPIKTKSKTSDGFNGLVSDAILEFNKVPYVTSRIRMLC